MRLTFDVEPNGWGHLRLTDSPESQVTIDLRVSYLSDVFTKIINAFAAVAGGAESAEAGMGLEPGDAWLRIQRRGNAWSTIEIRIEDFGVVVSSSSFRVLTNELATIALGMAASVDPETYLEEWWPKATWPTETLMRLQELAQ